MGRRWNSGRGDLPARQRAHAIIVVLFGVAGLLAAYACLTSVIALSAPDPDRWAGWGRGGLATGSGLVLAALVASARWPRPALAVGTVGGLIAAIAAPWIAPIALLLGAAPALPGLVNHRR